MNRPIPTLHNDVAGSLHDSPPYILHRGQRTCTANRIVILIRSQKYLENQGVDTNVFKHSQYIRNTKQGLTLAYRMQTNRTSLDETRLPITADMIILYHRVTANNTPTPRQHVLFVAQLTGFTMVARVSEYLYTTKSAPWLSTEHVQFEMPNGTLVPAQHAHKHAHTRPTAVHIHIKTRKNDQQGRRHTLHFRLAHHTDKYYYVSEMWTHAQRARPKPNCPFFAISSEDWILKAPQLSLQLENIAVYLRIDSTRISIHSVERQYSPRPASPITR